MLKIMKVIIEELFFHKPDWFDRYEEENGL